MLRPIRDPQTPRRARAGRRSAEWTPPSWEELVRDHSARVYRLAYRLTGNRPDAEDLTQDVFVRVFRSLHRFQPGTFEGWLHRITTNLFLDGARRRQKIRFDGLADGSAERLPSALAHPVGAAGRRRPRPRRRRRAGRPVAGVPGRRGAVRHRGPHLRGDQRGARRQDRHRPQPDPPWPGPAPGRPRPSPADRSTAFATWASRSSRAATPRSRDAGSGAGEDGVRKAPCAELAELRSAYVDGALSDADRERLLAHLVGCADLPRGRRRAACRPRAADPDAGASPSRRLRTCPAGWSPSPARRLRSRCGPGRSGARRRRAGSSACPASAGSPVRGPRRPRWRSAPRSPRSASSATRPLRRPSSEWSPIPLGEPRRPSAPACASSRWPATPSAR